jgi:HAD superfamily hydrolase (TIGR01509 family)
MTYRGSQFVLFIDDGGVMNDNALREPQWRQLVGEFFSPRLGGDPSAWSEANRRTLQRQVAEFLPVLPSVPDYAAWRRNFDLFWIRHMCQLVGVESPADEAACLMLIDESNAWIIPRVRSAIPGAIDAIHRLHEQGYTLHTASGENWIELHGYLVGMEVRDLFDRLYGPDLVNTPKASARYYERIFADAGVSPTDAAVIDDNPAVLHWAAQTGATTVLLSTEATAAPGADLVVSRLAELPDALAAAYGVF